MGKVFAITSGKGGVGKSTVSTGLSLALSSLGYKVLLVDMDEGLRCLDLMLNLDDNIVLDLSDILGGRDINDATYKVNENLFLVPAPLKTGLIDAYSLANFAKQAEGMYDVVIFDFPAGIDFSLYSSLPESTLFLTVAFPDSVTIRDAAVVSTLLAEKGFKSRLIINRFDYKLSKRKYYKSIDAIIDESQLQLIGIVPLSEKLQLLSVGQSIKAKDKSMKALTRISKRLMGEHILLPKIKKI